MSYKWIVDRVRDDPVLSGVDIPLPNSNAKSQSRESRLLYILYILKKMLKNCPKVGGISSPSKVASMIKTSYRRTLADRVRDDPVLSGVDIPLPNIHAKSITAFFSRHDKRSNFLATAQPKVETHQKDKIWMEYAQAVEITEKSRGFSTI